MANEKPYKFNENIIVPVVQSNGRVEEKGLYITIWEDADMDRLQIQIRDWTNHSFNYIDFVDPENFEVMRSAQSLEMNFSGFKENIVAMLRQYQEDKMSLECHIFARKCTLIFYMKAKMGYLVLLTVDLKLDETIDESQSEEQEFQGVHDIQSIGTSRVVHIQNQGPTNILSFSHKLNKLQTKAIEIFEKENIKLTFYSTDQFMEDIVNLRVENIESNNLVDELNEDNNALHILIATLEESLINMGELVDGQHRIIMNSKMREIELVNKLRKLNIVVTENENTLDNFFQDAEEARKSVVGLKTLYDKKAQQCNKLQKSFEEYKRKFNEESFEAVKQDLVVSKKKEEELQKELQQMKKLNDLMTQEARQHTF